jgi:hypothetical protein
MKGLAALAALGVVGGAGLAACGGSGAGAVTDGGGAEGGAASSWRVLDVTATLTMVTADAGQGGGWSDFPRSFGLVLAWNAATGEAYTLGGGASSRTSVSAQADGTFTSRAWTANVAFATGCASQGTVALDEVTFSLQGDALTGSASGTATYITSGATMLEAAVTATLAGAPDPRPPAFSAPDAGVDPFAGVALEASEPLPANAAATLTAPGSSDGVPLAGEEIGARSGGLHGFSAALVALRYGTTYHLDARDARDFLGRAATAPVTFTTQAAPPLVPEDGFESVTGTMFAGAGVLQGGPLMPIAGKTSLLLNTGFGGGFGFLPYDLGPSLAVRLALAPGDSVVRFDAQLIAPDPIDQASFVGAIRYGSAGATIGRAQNVDGSGFTKVTLPQLGDIYITPVTTYDLELPLDAAGEITFEIIGQTFSCDAPPSPTVLVLDNLRVE